MSAHLSRCLWAALLAAAPAVAETSQISFTLRDGQPAEDGLIQYLDVRASWFPPTSAPPAELWSAVERAAAAQGSVGPGLVTGAGLRSLRVTIPALPPGTSLAEDAEMRDDWRQYERLASSFRTFAQAQAVLPASQRETRLGAREFLRFTLPSGGTDFTKAWVCGAVGHLSESDELSIPAFLQRRRTSLCAAQRDTPRLDFVANDRLDDEEPLVDLLELHRETYVGLRTAAWIACDQSNEPDASHADKITDLKAAGWISSTHRPDGSSLLSAEEECYAYVSAHVFEKLDEAMEGLATAGFRAELDPWSKSWLKPLALARAGNDVRASAKLYAALTVDYVPSRGFTHAPLDPSVELDYTGLVRANQQNIQGPGLIAILFGRTQETLSPWRIELAAMPREEALGYTRVLVLTVTRACASTQPVTASCLLQSRTQAPSKVWKVAVDSGEGLAWNGYVLLGGSQ